MPKGQFPEIIQLADLNGQYGFKIEGEAAGDLSGYPVATGDINGDGYSDVFIGAAWHNSHTGRSYAVFGSPDVGSSGLLSLADLDGHNGFKLDGESANDDFSGRAISLVGDVNGDAFGDLLIGAFGHNNGIGRSYVVFGGAEVGSSGSLPLSNLNGVNGFKLDGEIAGDFSGVGVSAAGDINRDGRADFLIGASTRNTFTGLSYVVFGGTEIGASGLLPLANLNGANGFKINGETAYDYSGYWVNPAGDINGDSYTDFLIGAQGYNNFAGRSYVVFGTPGIGSSGSLLLSSLNGVNGFKLDGEGPHDISGFPVSVDATGDINGDGFADLLIGAYGHNNLTGRSYVVFGGREVGSTGLLSLSNLNGINGFKLDGEAIGDYSGYAVSAAGDINGDDQVDLIIGAVSHNGKGRNYVVFGDSEIGNTGLLSLSSLNGSNGFKLDGETGSAAGYKVSIAGDINGDGVMDLIIGAPYYKDKMGCTYVVFGDIPPVLISNQLQLYTDKTILNMTNLAACDRNHDNATLLFVISNVLHGQFEQVNNLGVAINNFRQEQITKGAIQFVHDGSSQAPSYNIMVRSEGIAWTGPESATIIFCNKQPTLQANQVFIKMDQPTILTTDNLCADNCYDSAFDDLLFVVSDEVQHGQFEKVADPGKPTYRFLQRNIKQGDIQFVPDGTLQAPVYLIAGLTDSQCDVRTLSLGNTLLLTNNYFPINQGKIFFLTTDFLYATSNSGNDQDIFFKAVDVQRGHFSLASNPDYAIPSFKKSQIIDNQIIFVPNGTAPPSCTLMVQDEQLKVSGFFHCQVDFAIPPQLETPFLKINPPDRLQITTLNLQAIDEQVSASKLIFEVSKAQNCHFAYQPHWDSSISSFTQKNISNGQVYIIAKSDKPVSFMVSVSNGRLSCEGCPIAAEVVGSSNPLPATVLGTLGGLAIPGLKLLIPKIVQYYFSSREDSLDSRITNAILSKLWIGCCGIITGSLHENYVHAVSGIVQQLNIRETWEQRSDKQKSQIKSRIADEAVSVLVGQTSCCVRFFKSFCQSEATPDLIEEKTAEIVQRVGSIAPFRAIEKPSYGAVSVSP